MRLSHLTCAAAVLSVVSSCALWAADAPRAAADPRPAVVNIRSALGETIHELSVDAIPLGRVMDYLRDVSGANIVVNWKVLEAAGVSRDTAITLQVRELTLRKMLQLVLDQASPTSQLTFTTDANVLEITTQDEADKKLITKVYIVDDLVMTENRMVKPPTFNLDDITKSGSSSGSGGGGGTGGGGSLFEDTNSNTGGAEETSQTKGEQLVTLIREVVRPQIWKEAGGNSSIRYFSGKLIVTAPVSVHEAIGGPVGNEAQRFGM